MSKTKNLKCVVTGAETMYAGNFLSKKMEEYGSEENLEKYYVCKEVKAFLKKHYTISDIRKVLQVDLTTTLPSKDVISFLETQFKDQHNLKSTLDLTNISQFTNNLSDKDVEDFIHKYIM
jgi:hypothetical protein